MQYRFKFRVEFFFLIVLVLALPSFEAPKNIFWVAYILTWLFNRSKISDFGGSWDIWDSLIAAWILSGYIVATFAGLHHSEWGGANDVLRYGSILWVIKRSSYGERELRWLLAGIIISTFLALSEGIWQLFVTHRNQTLQLNSVGHVNHSAIYLAISYGIALTALLAFWNMLSFFWKALTTLILLSFALGILISDSRAAVGVTILLTLTIALFWLRRSRPPFFILTTCVLVFVSSIYFFQANVVVKQNALELSNNVLSDRDQIWNGAFVAWKKFPLFGVGMGNYGKISMLQVETWVKETGKPFVASNYMGQGHAHSLYLNTLAERGLFGFSVLLAVLGFWFYSLIKFIPNKTSENLAWAIWGGSFSAWFITVGIGYVNTTMHHEHAILSAISLGMWLAYIRHKRLSSPVP